jgi:hypothetical protein
VLPYLTRAVLVMDWVAGCVDYGRSPLSLSKDGGAALMEIRRRGTGGFVGAECALYSHDGV